MIPGILPTVMSSAVSWVSPERMKYEVELIMVKELVVFCWMMLSAMVMNHTFGIALIVDGINMTVSMGKMQVWNVTNIAISQECILG
jgi:uncharacterized membrane protein HdeD (DUF308 family)